MIDRMLAGLILVVSLIGVAGTGGILIAAFMGYQFPWPPLLAIAAAGLLVFLHSTGRIVE